MKKGLINQVHVEGYLYEHKLERKTSKKTNQSYISGTISVATDEACSNIVEMFFMYVTPVYSKSQKDNPNYKVLDNIINSGTTKTIMGAGKENALKVRVDGSIGLNEFYNKDDELVSIVRNEVSFINTTTSLNEDESKRNTFKNDMLITSVIRKEANDERNIPEHVVLKGATINDYNKALLPISFIVYHPGAMDYFEGLEPSTSKPIFTKVAGNIVAQEFVSRVELEGAFGQTLVEEKRSTKKEYVVNWAQNETYEWDSEDGILASELKDMMSQRELHLAEIKKNKEEYQKSKESNSNTAPAAASVSAPAAGDFKF